MKQAKPNSWLHAGVLRVARLHFLYVVVFIVQTLVYDAWKLIAPLALFNRWIASALLLIITTAVWYIARSRALSTFACKLLVFTLVVSDIALASFNIYTQRGMASRAVMLYAVPIIVSAVLLSRSAIFATAALSVAAYTATAIAYFVLNFNEGYKIELYGEVGFYSVMFFVLASLLWMIIRTKHPARKLQP